MSRGPGKLQDAILHLVHQAHVPLTIEKIRWILYESLGNPPVALGAKLPTKWNTSFRRAAQTLADAGRIAITARLLENFEECVEHYPGKTLSAEIRAIRENFLPALLEWTLDANGLGRRYGTASNELFRLKALPEDIRTDIETRWQRIEDPLRRIFGELQSSSDHLLRLICKGRALFRSRLIVGKRRFEASDIVVSGSLTGLIEIVCSGNFIPTHLGAELRDLKDVFLPTYEAHTLRFKSLIHELADVPRHGQCSLKQQTLEYLHQHQQGDVEQMAGFKRKVRQQFDFEAPRVEYDPKLRKLFDHSVFQKFHFVTAR